jgi:hypothetical protein
MATFSATTMNRLASDHVIVDEFPENDIKRTEELLGIKENILPNFTLGFTKGNELCAKCGRHYSVLDLISTALKIHSAEFLKKIIFSTEFTQGNGTQIVKCYECGKEGSSMIYATSKYSC